MAIDIDEKIDFILRDYSKQESTSRQKLEESDELDEFFRPKNCSKNNQSYDPVLLNNIGEKSLNKLVGFVTSHVFDRSGGWILPYMDESDNDSRAVSEKLADVLARKLKRTNFYSEISRYVSDFVVHNMGYIDVKHGPRGVIFRTENYKQILISDDEDYTRGYNKLLIPGNIMLSMYQNLPQAVLNDIRQNETKRQEVIRCILPNNPHWVPGRKKTMPGWTIVDIHKQFRIVLTPMVKRSADFKSFPVAAGRPHTKASICFEAFSDTINCEYYTYLERSRWEYNVKLRF